MRVETAAVIISAICFVIAIYFAGLTFQIFDEPLKMRLLALATSLFVGGVVVLIVLMIFLAIKRLLTAHA